MDDEPGDGRRLRVLVVDDDEVDRRWVRRALAPLVAEADLVEASDADAARRALREEAPFDCVLLDHHLGGDTGLGVLDAIRAAGVETPVVMLTGRGDEQIAVAALKSGASDYLSKTDVSAIQIRRAVRAAIRLAATESAMRQAQREREALIEELGAERERLHRAVAERDEVLAIVSHDMRNPLQTIAIAADAVEEDALDAESVRRYAAVIRRGVDRALSLIQDLLDLSRLEHGALTLDAGPTDVGALVRRVVDDHAMAARKAAVTCRCAVEGELAAVSLDPARIAQVLDNLIGNAIRHTPRGGLVTVDARRLAGELELLVRDTGPGVPEAVRPHLFDRFYQVEAKERPRGSAGLGLAIAKGIVEAHGGTIGVECPAGGGTIFRVSLPVKSESDRAHAPAG